LGVKHQPVKFAGAEFQNLSAVSIACVYLFIDVVGLIPVWMIPGQF